MRPYLAILRDSLREATSSRTLPVLLVFFTIVLVALAPIGLEERVSWRLNVSEIADQTLLLAKLRQHAGEEGPTPGKRVLKRSPTDLKNELGLTDEPAAFEGNHRAGLLELVNTINQSVLPDPTFYEPDAWDNANLPSEAVALLEQKPEELSEEQLKRLNRVLLTAAFPGALRPPPEAQVSITYLGHEMSGSLAPLLSDPEMVRRIVRQMLYAVCVWGIGPIGLLISIIVTADIMPRTFEPGSIDLLLSKPVNRALVFLTKFVGACAFVLISFTYPVAGLWLIFGLRLGEWSPQLWGVVPLFIFSFAVIYSISAVVGLRYRSPIVAVFAAAFVWGAAFLVGVTNDFMTTFREFDRVDRIVPLDGTVLVTTSGRTAYLWNEVMDDWSLRGDLWQANPAAAPSNFLIQPRVLGPVYDPRRERFITANIGAGGSAALHIGTAERDWKTRPGALMPPGTRDLFLTDDGRLFAAGLAGLFEFHGDPTIAKEEFKLFGVYDLIPADADNTFVRIDDQEGLWGEGMSVALDNDGRHAAIYRSGVVTRLAREDGEKRFEKVVSLRLANAEEAEPALIAVTSGLVILAEESGEVHLMDAATLQERATLQPNAGAVPKSVIVNPAGTILAVLFHDGVLWLYDLQAAHEISEEPAGQGDLTALAFDSRGNLWVADKLRRVRTYELPGLSLLKNREGSLDTMEMIYRYALTPLTYILPDTYGLRSVYEYLFTEETSEAMTGANASLEGPRRELQLTQPLIQNALFLGIVLGLASFYVTRKDF